MEKFMTFKISKIRYFDYFVSVENSCVVKRMAVKIKPG